MPRPSIGLSARLAILLACLGLVALVALPLLDGDDPPSPLGLDDLELALELGRHGEVQAELERRAGPRGDLEGDPAAALLGVRALAGAGRPAEARALLAAAALAVPQRELALARLALVQGDPDRALGHLAKLSPEPEILALAIRAREELGDLEGAAEPCRQLLELSPAHPDASRAWHLLARRAAGRGELDETLECLERASAALRRRAEIEARMRAVLYRPGEVLPRLLLARSLRAAGEPRRAEAQLDRILREHPGEARAWFELGELARGEGRAERAREAYDRALELDPWSSGARYGRARVSRELGDVEGARRDLRILLDSGAAADPDLAGARQLLDSLGGAPPGR